MILSSSGGMRRRQVTELGGQPTVMVMGSDSSDSTLGEGGHSAIQPWN